MYFKDGKHSSGDDIHAAISQLEGILGHDPLE